tara:strand:+ start:17279 stop:17611 length:333 start_codon:yes stop_codon:yes gene_type:complete
MSIRFFEINKLTKMWLLFLFALPLQNLTMVKGFIYGYDDYTYDSYNRTMFFYDYNYTYDSYDYDEDSDEVHEYVLRGGHMNKSEEIIKINATLHNYFWTALLALMEKLSS